MNYIQELRDIIRRLHGTDSEHVASIPVLEEFQGKTIWDGVVEVFNLAQHPTAFRVYAWTHYTDDPEHPTRHVTTVLHQHPIRSAHDAVTMAVVQEMIPGGAAVRR